MMLQAVPHVSPDLQTMSRVARSLAWRLAPADYPRQDLYGAAMLGLTEAVSRHDPSRGNGLLSYAFPRMRGRVLDEVRRERRWRQAERALIAGAADAPLPSSPVQGDIMARAVLQTVVAKAAPAMPTDERLILREVYMEGRELQAVSDEQGWSARMGSRRHCSLIDRLRRAAGVVPACDEGRDSDEAESDER